MSIADAARATRRYAVHYAHGEPYWVVCKIGERRRIRGPGAMTAYTTEAEAQAACDRLNLVAVLEALQEPSEAMVDAGWIDKEDVNPDDIWRAMIDALLFETKETTMPDLDLDAIEKLAREATAIAAEATPGPWTDYVGAIKDANGVTVLHVMSTLGDFDLEVKNAYFAASARNIVPVLADNTLVLIERVRELQEKRVLGECSKACAAAEKRGYEAGTADMRKRCAEVAREHIRRVGAVRDNPRFSNAYNFACGDIAAAIERGDA